MTTRELASAAADATIAAVRVAIAALLAVVAGFGCTTSMPASPTYDAGGGGVGAVCATTDDCMPPNLCAWPLDGGCSAQGRCVPIQEGCEPAEAGQPFMCACDGTPFKLACTYGKGNSPEPVASPTATCPTLDAAPTD